MIEIAFEMSFRILGFEMWNILAKNLIYNKIFSSFCWEHLNVGELNVEEA